MRTLLLCAALCGALVSSSAFAGKKGGDEDADAAPPRPSKNVAALPKAPKIDGELGDLKSGTPIASTSGPEAWNARASYKGDTLYVGISVTDDKIMNGDIVSMSIFFPGAGVTARGYEWRFAQDGMRAQPEDALPSVPAAMTKSAVKRNDKGMTVEIGVPAKALPRFPATEPMVFELCISYEDRDEPAASPVVSTNCKDGQMTTDALRLPDDFRKSLKLKPSDKVIGLEGRENGWVGYAVLHYPVWVAADQALTAGVLRSLVTEDAYDPKKAGINLPESLVLPGDKTVLSVLSGKDPYETEGKCEGDRELRFALYLVQGRTAERVLEWPASTCGLGRAAAFDLDDKGELTVGYTLGSTATFVWSKDHFERTEVGTRE